MYNCVFNCEGDSMKPGVYSNISNYDYHTGPGISNSGLSLVRKSPMHYRVKKLAANDNAPQVSTPAQMIGTAFHALLLEPEFFYRDYCLGLRQSDVPEAIDSRDQLVAMVAKLNETRLPKLATSGSKNELVLRVIAACEEAGKKMSGPDADELESLTAAELKSNIEQFNKERAGLLPATGTMEALATLLRTEGVPVKLWSDVKSEWMANNGQRLVLTPDQWEQLHNMRAAVFAHPVASKLMQMEGKAEQSVYWTDKETGELCRCRPDWWPGNLCVDLKTTDDASPLGFAKSIANYGYDTQDAFYTDGLEAVGKPVRALLFLAVEKTAHVVEGQSFGVAVYQLDEASRALGRAKYRADLNLFAQCVKSGKWPNYGDAIQPISLPQWQFSQHQHLVDGVA